LKRNINHSENATGALVAPAVPCEIEAWQDAVLSQMFYVHPETEGARIAGRPLLVAATAGNTPVAYTPQGTNLFPLQELLKPLRSTANRCGLAWREPFLLFESRAASDEALGSAAERYAERLRALTGDDG
jgi:putative NADPH-quinone reductase